MSDGLAGVSSDGGALLADGSEGQDDGGDSALPAAPPPSESQPEELDVTLREKLHGLLRQAPGQLGSVYRAMVDHPDLAGSPTDLLPYTDCANAGAVGNRRVVVQAVMDGITPASPSRARQAAASVRTLRKLTEARDVLEHLAVVLATLEDEASDATAVELESKELASESEALAVALEDASGVYVYTYPHYWRHPYLPDSERRMLKVGRTTGRAWARVLTQARQTGMPEDPLLLRVYPTDDPVGAEKAFHMLLDAAEHDRSAGSAVGVEWFVTTLEFCDAIAAALRLDPVRSKATE